MSSLFRSKRVRSITSQVLVLLGVVILIGYLGYNTSVNLEKTGIASGFRFLGERAGYPINFSVIHYSPDASTHFDAYIVGILNTILFTVVTIAITTVLAVLLALARLSSNWLLSNISTVIVEYFRNVPMLLHLFVWLLVFVKLPPPKKALSFFDAVFISNRGLYYPDITAFGYSVFALFVALFFVWAALMQLTQKGKISFEPKRIYPLGAIICVGLVGVAAVTGSLEITRPVLRGFNFKGGSVIPPELVNIVVAISTYSAAHASELIRGSILAVPKGMTEAAKALGAGPWLTQRAIIFPIAMKSVIPPMTSTYVNILKASALGVVVGFMGVMTTTGGSTLNITGQAVECIVLVVVAYMVMNLGLAFVMGRINRNFNRLGEK